MRNIFSPLFMLFIFNVYLSVFGIAQEASIEIFDFKVNENVGPSSVTQWSPSIAKDSIGNFIITWSDHRNGGSDIYAQRYSSDGTALGVNFQVNDSNNGSDPSIVIDKNGAFVIVWNGGDIYAQRFANDGVALGNNFKVNDDNVNGGLSPSIAANQNGDFVITWLDELNGSFNVYAQRYSEKGIALGNNFKVNEYDGSGSFPGPAIAIDGNDNFVIAWKDGRNEGFDIYVQRYSNNGMAVGSNFKVNDDGKGAWKFSIDIVADANGNFIITWEDGRNGDIDIYAQRYSGEGTMLANNFRINDDEEDKRQRFPSISINSSEHFVIAWEDHRNDYKGDIYAQIYLNDGTSLGNNFVVNDDNRITEQSSASTAADTNGDFVVTWVDRRDTRFDSYDIYAQRFSSDGSMLGSNFQVNDERSASDYPAFFTMVPSIAIDNNGNFAIVWNDDRNGDNDIYAQRYLNDGTSLGVNFQINDDDGTAEQINPDIAIDKNGNSVITWNDDRNHNNDIYAQRYSSDGTALGDNLEFENNEVTRRLSSSSFYSSISMNQNGDFIVIWHVVTLPGFDHFYGAYDIHGQRYSSDGKLSGNDFKINNNDRKGIVSRNSYPSIAMHENGDFVVGWIELHDVHRDIYAQRCSNDGIPIGDNFQVNDHESVVERPFSIAIDIIGDFIIVWEDSRNGYSDIYAQRYLSNGNTLGKNFKVNSTNKNPLQYYPNIKLWNNRIYSTWTDGFSYLSTKEFDIWANVLNRDNLVEIRDSKQNHIPFLFALYQNYPNPFNPTTEISYSISRPGLVNLTVYDVLGRKIQTLVNTFQEPNNYSIHFDANKLSSGVPPSGIYFYKLQVGPSTGSGQGIVETKKMLLMR